MVFPVALGIWAGIVLCVIFLGSHARRKEIAQK